MSERLLDLEAQEKALVEGVVGALFSRVDAFIPLLTPRANLCHAHKTGRAG